MGGLGNGSDISVFSSEVSVEAKVSVAIGSFREANTENEIREIVLSTIAKIQNRDEGISLRDIGVTVRSLRYLYAKIYEPRNLWYGCRKVDHGIFENISNLIYISDPKFISIGRCNFPGSQVLYASINHPTAFSEMNTEPGDVIQWISIKTDRSDFKFQIIGDLHYGFMSGCSRYYNKDFAAKRNQLLFQEHGEHSYWMLAADGLIGEIYSIANDKPNSGYAYSLTSLISEIFYRIMPDPAIAYPSVKANGGVNIALQNKLFDQDFYVHQCGVVEVSDYLGYHLYEMKPLRFANADGRVRVCHDVDGNIEWDL